MKKVESIIVALSLGILYNYFEQNILKSDYLLCFIKDNLVMLLIALLAINSTTMALVLTKIKELIDKSGKIDAFQKTKKEMLFSVKEHIVLILLSIFFLVLNSSPIIQKCEHITRFCNVLLISDLMYSLFMLYDVSKSAFIILDFNSSENNNRPS